MTKFKIAGDRLNNHPKNAIAGAKFKAASFFRPTAMSAAMAAAGIIPAAHLIRDFKNTGILRHKNDARQHADPVIRAHGLRPSVQVAF